MKLLDIINCPYDIEISGITDDSRRVSNNYLFVATKGYNVDHFDYIDDAIKNGAVAVIVDRPIILDVATILVDDLDKTFHKACQKFYGINPIDFTFIGITGTDGKTTSTTLVKDILEEERDIAYIGTNGLEIKDQYYPTSNTTPCVDELYKLLRIAKDNNCYTIAMEVSSEAILHKRIADFRYKIVGYTNITEDHLNVHGTLENYINCKLSLANYVDELVVINGDDDNCIRVNYPNIITYGFKNNNDYVIFDEVINSDGCSFKLKNKDNTYLISSPLTGRYNIYNLTLAFIISLNMGIDKDKIINRIKEINFIKGRGERLEFGQDYTIVLDYAHTYNGIKSLLDAYKDKKTIVVTGAAGGREKEKRSKIGSLLLDQATFTIFTMDDPRYERVIDIINDMLQDTTKTNYLIEEDRVVAIHKAFSMAETGDVVLVIGKGRDNYMAVFDKKLPYSDYEVIEKYFNQSA